MQNPGILHQFFHWNVDRCSYIPAINAMSLRFRKSIPVSPACIIKSNSIIKHFDPPWVVVTRLIPPQLNGLVLGNWAYPGDDSRLHPRCFSGITLYPGSSARSGAFPIRRGKGRVNKCERGDVVYTFSALRDASPVEDTSFLPTSPT